MIYFIYGCSFFLFSYFSSLRNYFSKKNQHFPLNLPSLFRLSFIRFLFFRQLKENTFGNYRFLFIVLPQIYDWATKNLITSRADFIKIFSPGERSGVFILATKWDLRMFVKEFYSVYEYCSTAMEKEVKTEKKTRR